jgi:hypothetical protein
MKKRTKVILGTAAVLLFGLVGARAARNAKWERWIAAQEANFQAARRAQQAKVGVPLAAPHAVVGAGLQSDPNAQQSQSAPHDHAQPEQHAASPVMSAPQHQHMEAHMRWTAPRTETPDDLARANSIVQTLRASLDRYQDYKNAVDDGYEPFLPDLDLPMYHFTNYRRGLAAAFDFDPARPTSLLYRKHPTHFELIGVMYTAPRRFSEDQLNQRVPLSVARWHQHVNICLPSGSPRERALADWSRFGPTGAIATESACTEAGGRWQPVLFGWMVHVYPFQQARERIWTH